jgi:hypothetical protein
MNGMLLMNDGRHIDSIEGMGIQAPSVRVVNIERTKTSQTLVATIAARDVIHS